MPQLQPSLRLWFRSNGRNMAMGERHNPNSLWAGWEESVTSRSEGVGNFPVRARIWRDIE